MGLGRASYVAFRHPQVPKFIDMSGIQVDGSFGIKRSDILWDERRK